MGEATPMGEFQVLDFKVIGSDVVCWKLEDGTLVKAKIILAQAGLSKTKARCLQYCHRASSGKHNH
jgi:hypothetical protein